MPAATSNVVKRHCAPVSGGISSTMSLPFLSLVASEKSSGQNALVRQKRPAYTWHIRAFVTRECLTLNGLIRFCSNFSATTLRGLVAEWYGASLRSTGRGFDSRPSRLPVLPWTSCTAVLIIPHLPLSPSSINLLPAQTGNVAVGLASHWPCVTDTVVYPPTGSTAKDREMSTYAYAPLGPSTH